MKKKYFTGVNEISMLYRQSPFVYSHIVYNTTMNSNTAVLGLHCATRLMFLLQTNPSTLQIKVITDQGHFEAERPLTLNLQTWGRQSAI